MLYALGIGFQEDPLNSEHFRFTYEGAKEFSVFPTAPVIVCHRRPLNAHVPGIPQINPAGVVHGEESLQILKPIVPGKKYKV